MWSIGKSLKNERFFQHAKSCLTWGIALILLVCHPHAGTFVSPDDAQLQYVGRFDFDNPSGPLLSWPGSSVEGRFTGSSLTLKLDDQFGNNYFNIFLDGDLLRPVVLHAVQGSRTYQVASGLSPGPHSFLLSKRTEGAEGATAFQGVVLETGAKMLAAPPRKQRRIEFFGDSITAGMGNEAAVYGREDLPADKNNFMSYASITARNLDAEAHIIAQSGIGIMISWVPFTMPDFYDQLSAVGNNESRWDFNRWTPDVVVINLMQNDKWLMEREKRIVRSADDRVQAYKRFVQRIRSLYPRAYIVCALGSMDATRSGSDWPGYVRSALEQIRREENDRRIDAVFFDFTGFEGHPRIAQHRANANRLTAFIRERMGW